MKTKLIYFLVFCWPPNRSDSGQQRMNNQIPGGKEFERALKDRLEDNDM